MNARVRNWLVLWRASRAVRCRCYWEDSPAFPECNATVRFSEGCPVHRPGGDRG